MTQRHRRSRPQSKSPFILIAAALIAAGIGVLCLFLPGSGSESISRDEADYLTGTLSQVETGSDGSIRLIFDDLDDMTIPADASNASLPSTLQSLHAGDELELLVHPDRDEVLELTINGRILMPFAGEGWSLMQLIGWSLLGLAVLLGGYLIVQKLRGV